MKILFAIVTAVAMLGAGCAPMSRPNGSALVINRPIPLETVKNVVINSYLSWGWKLDRESDHMLVFSKVNENFGASFFFGSQYDRKVVDREMVVISGTGSNVRIHATQEIVTNYGSAFERTNPSTNPGAEEGHLRHIQVALYLEGERALLEQQKAAPGPAVQITKSRQNTPADSSTN